MSIGIEFIRRPEDWRLEFDRRLDLSKWEIELTPGKISCVPRSAEFLLMVFGATLFICLAIFIAAYAIKRNWLAVFEFEHIASEPVAG